MREWKIFCLQGVHVATCLKKRAVFETADLLVIFRGGQNRIQTGLQVLKSRSSGRILFKCFWRPRIGEGGAYQLSIVVDKREFNSFSKYSRGFADCGDGHVECLFIEKTFQR